MVYFGMDVHRKRTQIAVLDEEGSQLVNRNVDNGSAQMREMLFGLDAGTEVCFEAGIGTTWLLDLLEEAGLHTHLAHPSACKAIASAKLKNDRVDARTLAHLLRTNLLAEAWIAPRPVRDQRARLRHRAALVRARTAAKVRVQAVLADHGIKDRATWTGPGRRSLEALQLPETQRRVIEDCCALIDTLDPMIRRIERYARNDHDDDPRLDALMKLPGVGWITALTLVAEIGDITRFDSARKLCSWAGLTPTVRGSDRVVHHGHITKQGATIVRWVLGEAAQRARTAPEFADAFKRISARRGRNIATVAVARKLLSRAFHILKEVEKNRTGSLETVSSNNPLAPNVGGR